MAVIPVVADRVAVVFPATAEIYDLIAGELVTAGTLLCIDPTTHRVIAADANVAGRQTFAGVALNRAGAGQAVSVLKRGQVGGFTVTQNSFAQVFVSDTVGALDDAAGTVSIPVGRIVPTSDANLTRLVYVEAQWR